MPGSGAVRRVPVVVAAAGAPWEPRALALVEQSGDLALHRRSVDVQDLLASAATGLVRWAVVADTLSGLDADTVAALGRAAVRTVVVTEETAPASRARLARLGAARVVDTSLADLVEVLRTADDVALSPSPAAAGTVDGVGAAPGARARLTVVWGPTGAPGRTTVATALAAEHAARGTATLLVDADPWGGAVAQHLGVLDQASGLLAASRRANAGELGAAGLAEVARTVGDLRVLTGLPRPDRWAEVRAAAYAEVLESARELVDRVVVDVGHSLEDGPGDPFSTAPRRNETTLAALARADDVVVVGSADPVGLSRLARALVDLRELLPTAALDVVVNRTRRSMGWSRTEVRGMVEGYVRPVRVHFWPYDLGTADRALQRGRSVVEVGDSALRRAAVDLVDVLAGPVPGPSRTRRRGRSGQEPKSSSSPPTV